MNLMNKCYLLINPNLNGRIPLNSLDVMKKEKDLFLILTNDEKEEMISSLAFLGTNFENFVIKFYEGFLASQTLKFIQNRSKEDLINMFSSALNLIITSIEQPIPLEEYMDILINKQPGFAGLIKNKELFIKSFMNALIDSFKQNYTERLGLLWYKSAFNTISQMNTFLNN